jgi:hypothetical protein
MITDKQFLELVYRYGGCIEHRIGGAEDLISKAGKLKESMETIYDELVDVESTEDLGSYFMAAYMLAREIQDSIVQEMTAYVGNGEYIR